jgi:hypothetical protein
MALVGPALGYKTLFVHPLRTVTEDNKQRVADDSFHIWVCC